LWGRLTLPDGTEVNEEDVTSFSHQMARKEKVVSWLRSAINADLVVGLRDELLSNETNSLQRVLDRVTEGQIEKALDIALNTGEKYRFYCRKCFASY